MKYFIVIFIIICMTNCKNKINYIDERFEGFWAETMWAYEFKSDGSFKFITDGHYSRGEYRGKYIISDSIIFLNPDTDWQIFDGVLKTRLKIMNSNCIRDFDSNFYCKDVETINKLNEEEFGFQENTIRILDSLPIVKDERKRLSQIHREKNDFEESRIKIKYDGIVVVNKKELHLFNLEQFNSYSMTTRNYLNFLINKKPFEIYEHHNRRDSLSLIYKK